MAAGLNATNPTLAIPDFEPTVCLSQGGGIAGGGVSTGTSGLIEIYDGSRDLWLTVRQMYLSWGWAGNNVKNQYLGSFSGVNNPSSGSKMFRNAIILTLTAAASSNSTYTASIRKNGSATDLVSITLTNGVAAVSTELSVLLDVGDYINCYMSGTSVSDPLVRCLIAWRR